MPARAARSAPTRTGASAPARPGRRRRRSSRGDATTTSGRRPWIAAMRRAWPATASHRSRPPAGDDQPSRRRARARAPRPASRPGCRGPPPSPSRRPCRYCNQSWHPCSTAPAPSSIARGRRSSRGCRRRRAEQVNYDVPIFMASGAGGRITDADGNEYVDLMMAYGALLHGHAHPRLVAAGERALRQGTLFATASEMEADVAERISALVPGAERVRFANTGHRGDDGGDPDRARRHRPSARRQVRRPLPRLARRVSRELPPA